MNYLTQDDANQRGVRTIADTGAVDDGGNKIGAVHVVQVGVSGTKTPLVIAQQPSTTEREIAAANSSRKGLVLYNNGAQTVYLGKDNTVTTSNYMEVLPVGARLADDSTTDAWWGITASGTAALVGYEVV